VGREPRLLLHFDPLFVILDSTASGFSKFLRLQGLRLPTFRTVGKSAAELLLTKRLVSLVLTVYQIPTHAISIVREPNFTKVQAGHHRILTLTVDFRYLAPF